MKLRFEEVRRKNKIISFCIIAMFLFLIISQHDIVADEQQWKPVPEANYADVLELIAFRAKANYEEISSWQGRMNIFATDHFYGTDAAQKTHAVDTNSIARDSQHICLIAKTIADFAVDMRNDKLYSNVEPNVQYKAVDLDQNVPVSKNTRTPKTRTIMTPDNYIWYIPDGKFLPKSQIGRPGKMVFIESSQNENVKWFVQDPRRYFNVEENRKLWEVILLMRKALLEGGNIRISDYPYMEITSMGTSSGIKYRILSTFKGGDVIKYIRILLEVDETVGFNVIKREETFPDGVKRYSTRYTYEDFNGIFVPKTFWMESRNNKGELTGTSEITIETISINKPLPEDTFTIKNLGVEENTLVTDNIKKAEFRYSKGNLVPISEPNNPPD